MNRFNIVGLGPGNVKYILPIALETIKNSDILIGGKRNLKVLEKFDKEEFTITGDLKVTMDFIEKNIDKKIISVVVSGDTGFYSMLGYLSKNLKKTAYNVIPGISSLQYMYSKLGIMYNNGLLTSVHGRENNYMDLLKEKESIGLLTDKKNNPLEIAKQISNKYKDISKFDIYIGENLSYKNEKILKYKVDELINEKKNFSELNVVIIINNEVC